MMKILFKLFAILVIFNSTAIADIISKVEVKGNQRISKDTIIVLGEIQLNQDFVSYNFFFKKRSTKVSLIVIITVSNKVFVLG